MYAASISAVVLATGKQPAVAAGKDPAPVVECGHHLATVVFDAKLRMLSWQQDIVIELRDDFAQLRAHEQKIDDEVILVERPVNFGRHVVIVAVQSFARAAERDEMGRAENVLSFGDSDVEGFSHCRVGTAHQVNATQWWAVRLD